MANANQTSSGEPNDLRRFRVYLVQKSYFHLDVLARSRFEAADIAIVSSEWWVDDNDGDADVRDIEPVAPDDPDFSPPKDACRTCGRTLALDEDEISHVCDGCSERTHSV